MRTMWRYEVKINMVGDDSQPKEVMLTDDPVQFEPLPLSRGVGFWAEHNSDKPERLRKFIIVGTGHPIPEGAVYVGTPPRTEHGLVWHLYEVTDPQG